MLYVIAVAFLVWAGLMLAKALVAFVAAQFVFDPPAPPRRSRAERNARDDAAVAAWLAATKDAKWGEPLLTRSPSRQ